jgi:hypothetical protein
VTNIDDDSSALGDEVVAIDEIGEIGCGVLEEVLGLVDFEPLVLVALLVEDLLVR